MRRTVIFTTTPPSVSPTFSAVTVIGDSTLVSAANETDARTAKARTENLCMSRTTMPDHRWISANATVTFSKPALKTQNPETRTRKRSIFWVLGSDFWVNKYACRFGHRVLRVGQDDPGRG